MSTTAMPEQISIGEREASPWHDARFQAYALLRTGFAAAPILFGLDKFFEVLVDWPIYLAPWVNDIAPGSAQDFMYVVGVVEILAGVLVAVKPRYGAYLVAAWLGGIIVNLLSHSRLLRHRAARLRPADRSARARAPRSGLRRSTAPECGPRGPVAAHAVHAAAGRRRRRADVQARHAASSTAPAGPPGA